VRGRDAAQRLPPRVRRREPDHGPRGEPRGAGHVRDGARRERTVVPRERLPRGVARGDDHGRGEPQLEAHDGAVDAREARERVVEVAVAAAQIEEVADEWERPRARRQPSSGAAAAAGAWW